MLVCFAPTLSVLATLLSRPSSHFVLVLVMSCPYVQLRFCSFVRGRLGTPPGRSNATTVNGVLFYNCVILSASVLSGANPVNAQVKKKGVAATASVCTTTGRQGTTSQVELSRPSRWVSEMNPSFVRTAIMMSAQQANEPTDSQRAHTQNSA